nr:peptidylprolyl isomerase [Desulfosarcina ovata]
MTTSMGDIVIELDPAAAPKTVDNFLAYVNAGFYDGTIFHRVIAGFMIQGGGFDAQMQRKATRPPVVNEADNGLSNRSGSIAMARTSDPHSASAQFFINVKDNDFLDHRAKNRKGWGYCVFGKVVAGMNVVQAIEHVATTVRSGMRDVPEAPVVIEKVAIVSAATD